MVKDAKRTFIFMSRNQTDNAMVKDEKRPEDKNQLRKHNIENVRIMHRFMVNASIHLVHLIHQR